MAINKNHEFEELDGVKCAIVEKNASKERVDFLKPLLEFNKYTVVIKDTTVVKPPPPPPTTAVTEGTIPPPVPAEAAPPAPPPPSTYTIGVTDVSFNPTNAIFGRLLKTKEGNVVSLAYWQQKEQVSDDETPYFDKAGY